MRCKRCGSVLNYEDVMCKGCGRSLVDLKAQDEIEFDENATVNVEPIKRTETPKVEIEEEKKPDDIFGDAIYNEENKDNNVASSDTTNEVIGTSIANEISEVSVVDENSKTNIASEPLNESISEIKEEEKLNIEPLNETIENNEQVKENIEVIEPAPLEPSAAPLPEVEPLNEQPALAALNSEDVKEELMTKKKSKKGLIIVIITLIVLALAGVVTYFYMKTNPKSIFETGMNKLFSYANLDKMSNSNMKSEGYLRLSFADTKQDKMLEILNGLTIDVKLHIDKTNRIAMMDLDSGYYNGELLNSTIYAANGQIYGLLENFYTRYIGYPLDAEIYNKIFEDDDYFKTFNIIIEELNKEFNNSLDKKYLTRSISGMEALSTFSLNKSNYQEFITSLFASIKNNDTLINNISTLTAKSSVDIKQNIDNELTNINEQLEAFKITISSNILDGSVKKIEAYLDNSIDEITFTLNVIDKSNYDFTYKINEQTNKGSLNIADKEGYTEYAFTIEDNEYGKVTYTLGYKLTNDETLALPVLDDAINYDQLPEEELEMVLTSLLQNEGILKIYELFYAEDQVQDVEDQVQVPEEPPYIENVEDIVTATE